MLEAVHSAVLPEREAFLIGSESVGKSALFRQMTRDKKATVSNVKGSTVSSLTATCKDRSDMRLIDLPGMQLEGDSKTTQLALDHAKGAETILMVVKATSLKEDVAQLQSQVKLKGKKVAIIATHRDKYQPTKAEKDHIRSLLQVPITWINARKMNQTEQQEVIRCIVGARSWGAPANVVNFLPSSNAMNKLLPILRAPFIGPLIACLFILAMFALPVYVAYIMVSWLEPITEVYVLAPLILLFEQAPELLVTMLVGDYGLITLGWYSFLWAFPVVLFMGLSTAITEEIGIQEHITYALDPWLRSIGLTGKDLLPVLTGFGCNVVAVMQSRSCSSCTRESCISMISFGSACSYQIGATLSIFNAVHAPILFIPYLLLLFLVGAMHTRIWNRTEAAQLTRVAPLPYLQGVSWNGLWWKVSGVVKQFLVQAMPVFLLICLVASLFEMIGALSILNVLAAPILYLFSLPADAAPGLIFSFIRKDGLLVLNQGQGSLLLDMSTSHVFILVYLASTLSACLVTLFTIGKEMSWGTAGLIGGKQMLTSLISAGVLSVGLAIFI